MISPATSLEPETKCDGCGEYQTAQQKPKCQQDKGVRDLELLKGHSHGKNENTNPRASPSQARLLSF